MPLKRPLLSAPYPTPNSRAPDPKSTCQHWHFHDQYRILFAMTEPNAPQGKEPALGGEHRSRAERNDAALGGSAAVLHIVQLLDSDDGVTRSRALRALDDQMDGVSEGQVVARLLALAEESASSEGHSVFERSLLIALARTGHPDAVSYLIDLAKSDQVGSSRYQAIDAMGVSRRAEYGPLLLETTLDYIKTGYADERMFAKTARALGSIGRKHPESIQALVDYAVDWLTRPDVEQVWGDILRLLAVIRYARPRGIIEPMVDIMRNPRWGLDTRIRATKFLRAARLVEASPALIDLVSQTSNGPLRRAAGDALKSVRNREDLPSIVALLGHRNWRVRRIAVEILGVWRDKSTILALSALMDDPRAEVREATGDALARIDPEEALPYLTELLSDRVKAVRNGAAFTMMNLTLNNDGLHIDVPNDVLDRLEKEGTITSQMRRWYFSG
ncbi:MAG: HEAT repeat domain-containing protein [Chloroflexi bacterium]|nr:HEAT repeat domain-containing protein [Chloroflexota bacterium]